MADDEVRPLSDPQSGQATPYRGVPRVPPMIEGTADDIGSNPMAADQGAGQRESAGEARHPADAFHATTAERAADATVHKPSMAAAAADLAAEAEAAPARRSFDDDAPAAQPLATRRSRMPGLLAALGVVLILLLGAILYTLYFPPNGDAVATLDSEVAGLKSQVAALDARPAPIVDLRPLDSRIAALEGQTAQLKTDLAAARAKLDVAATTSGDAAQAGLAPLQSKIGDFDKSLTTLESTVAAVPKVDLGPVETRIGDVGDKVTALQATVAALPRIDLTPLDGRIADLDRRLKPVEAALSTAKATQQVTVARQEGSAAETRAAPVAVTAQAALAAIPAGRSYQTEVEALKALGVAGDKLAPLQPDAAKGAATNAELIAGFAEAEAPILGAGGPKGGGSVLDRMMAGAGGLVKIRPAGARAGDDPDAVVSRIEGSLKAGDLAAALGAWNQLPADAKTQSQAWADRLKRRVEAEAAARGVAADAIAAIAAAQ